MFKRFISLLLALAMLLSLGVTAVASDDASAAPPAESTETPAEPTEAPAESTETPAAPTEAPAEPTEAPAEPTEAPAEPTEAPAEPAEAPAEATEEPAEPTEAPAEATEEPAEPAAAAAAGTDKVESLPDGKTLTIHNYIDDVDGYNVITYSSSQDWEVNELSIDTMPGYYLQVGSGNLKSKFFRFQEDNGSFEFVRYTFLLDGQQDVTVTLCEGSDPDMPGPVKLTYEGPDVVVTKYNYMSPDGYIWVYVPKQYEIEANGGTWDGQYPRYCYGQEEYKDYAEYCVEANPGVSAVTITVKEAAAAVLSVDGAADKIKVVTEGPDYADVVHDQFPLTLYPVDYNSYVQFRLDPDYKCESGAGYTVDHGYLQDGGAYVQYGCQLQPQDVSGGNIAVKVVPIDKYHVTVEAPDEDVIRLTDYQGNAVQVPGDISRNRDPFASTYIDYELKPGYKIEFDEGDNYYVSINGEPAEDGWQSGRIYLNDTVKDGDTIAIRVSKLPTYTVKLAGGNDAHITLTVNGETKEPPFAVTEYDRIGYVLDEDYVIKDVDYVYHAQRADEQTLPGKVTGDIYLQDGYLSDGKTVEIIVNAAKSYHVSVADGSNEHITLYLDGVQQNEPFTMWEYQEITYLVDKGYVIDDGEHFYVNPYSEQDVPDKTGGYIYINSDTPSETSVVISVRERKQYQLNTIVSDGAAAASVISLTADGAPLAPDGLFWEDAEVLCTLDPNYTVASAPYQQPECYFEGRGTDEEGNRKGRLDIESDYNGNGKIDLYVAARESIKVNIIDETNGASAWRITYDGEPLHEGVNEIFAEHNLEYELKEGFIFAANTECSWWEDEYGGHSDMRRGGLNVRDEDGDGVVTVTIRAIRDLILILPSSDILTVQYEGKTLSTGAAVPEDARLQYRLAPHCTFEWGGQYTEFSTTGPDTEGQDGYTDGELMLSDYDGDGKVAIKATQASKFTLRLQGEADKLTLTVNGGELSDGSTIWGNQSLRFVLASGYVIDEMESEGGINYYSESSDGTTRGELYFYDSNGDGACTIVVRKLQTFAVQFNSDEIALYRGTTALASGDTASERDCLTYKLQGKRVLKDSDEYWVEQFDGTGEPYLVLQDENGDGTVKIETVDGVAVTVTGEYKAANITIATFGENGGSQPVPTSGGMTARGYEITVGVDAAYSIQVPGVEFDYAEYNWQEDDAVRRLRHWYNFTVPADSDGIVIDVYADPDSVPTIYDVVYEDSDGHIDSWDKRMYSKALAGERFLLTVDAGYRLEADNAATRTEGGIDGNLNILVTVDRDLAPGTEITVRVVKDDGLKLVLQGAVGHAVFTRGQSVLATEDTVYEGEQVRAVPDSGYVVTAMGMYPHTDWGYNEKITWIQIQDSNHDGEVHLRVEEGAVLSIAGDLDGVEPYAIRSLDGATFAVGDSVSITLKPGYELAGQECNNYANDEDGKLMRDYYITVEKTGPMTLTIQKETQALKSIPVNCNGPEGAFITKPEEAMPGSWFSVALSQGYYATAEGAELSLQGYTESMFAGAVLPDATSVEITAQKAAWRAKLRVTSGKDQVVAYDDYFVSSLDGDTLPYGIGTVAVKNGYELKAGDGAIVGGGMIIQEGKEIYRVYTVIATKTECKVAVTASAATARLMAVTIDNEAKADYDLPSAYYEDGTYYVIAYGSSVAASYRIQLEEGYGVKSGDGDCTVENIEPGYWVITQTKDAATLKIVKISPEVEAKVEAVENVQATQSQLENTLDSIISSVASGDGVTNGLGADAQKKIQDAIEQAEDALDGGVTLPTVAANLSVEKKEETAVAADAAKIEQAVGQAASVKQYLDISIAVTVNGQPAGNLTETDDVITFKVPVDGLDKDKDYSVARVHDGTVTMLKAWVEGDSLCFQSDKFSTYAVVSDYKVIDVNRDKLFSKADAVALFRFVSRGIYENVDVKEGDVVEDNGITLKDVTKLYQMANGK